MEDMPIGVKAIMLAALAVLLFAASIPVTEHYGLTHHFQPNWGWCCQGKTMQCNPATVCTKLSDGNQTCVQWESTSACHDLCATWVERKGSNGEECR